MPEPPVISLQDYANNSPVDITADTTVRNQQLRDYVRQIVANFQADRPWLQQTWHYIESQGENFSLQVSASNTLPGVERSERDATGDPECQPTDNPQDPFILSNVAEMHFPTSRFAHPNILQAAGNESTVIHELAHIYTLSCLAHPDNMLPMAATHLYFEDLSLAQAQDRRSFGHELLADAMVAEMESLLTWPEHARYHYYTAPLFGSPESWDNRPPPEAIAVIKSMLAGQVPQWFYDKFRLSDGTYNQQLLKQAIWGRIPNADRFRYRIDHYLRHSKIIAFEKPYG